MLGIDTSTLARADLVDHYIYLFDEAGEAMANRFFDNAEKSFTMLAAHPHIGAALTLRDPALSGMRKWAVEGFANHLIFYLPGPTSVIIVRVLHNSQDWWKRLGLVE